MLLTFKIVIRNKKCWGLLICAARGHQVKEKFESAE
jgi:hypothetical protein